MRAASILIIEDEHALGSALELLIRRMGHLPTLSASGKAGLKQLEETRFDAVIIDIGLPDMSGLEVLEIIRRDHGSLPVLVITAHATLQHAIDSQKSGASAYLNKPLDLEQLRAQLGAMLEPGIAIQSQADEVTRDPESPTLIGAAPCLRDAFVGIARACSAEFPVLITGPGGSGKSLAARMIHGHGASSSGPFHEVHAETLDRWQLRPKWKGGTLVLDEITRLEVGAQKELADWLSRPEGRELRLIATLSESPQQALEEGQLREDLYFALKPATIFMPPLRERSSDIPALCAFFAGLRDKAGKGPEITPPVMAALQSHSWPGNVRELKHVLDYAISMSGDGPLFLSHLPKSIAMPTSDQASGQLGSELEVSIQRWLDQELAASREPSYDELLQRLETELLKFLLQRFEHKPTRLATAMQLHRGTLRQKLQRCGIQ